MPELPEIETVKLQLQKVLVGQKLLKSNFPEVTGKTVKEIKRLGKVLLINFDKDLDLGFHFKMTGQLIYEPERESGRAGEYKRIVGGHPTEDMVAPMPSKHTRAIFNFEKGTLYFNDMRKFGWVMINPGFVKTLGPEPFDLNTSKFLKLLKNVKGPIKSAIMNQVVISGVGNIYANDALWEAKINPQIPSHKLQGEQIKTLLEKIKLVLREGIKYGGATAANYVNLHGLGGHYQDHFRTYNREGLPCLRCKTKIEKVVLGGRGTYYCPECQRWDK